MPDRTDAEVIALERRFPSWMVWTVRGWNGHRSGITWCASRHDGEGQVLNASSPDELVEKITEAGAAAQ